MGSFRVSRAALSDDMGSTLEIQQGHLMPHGRISVFDDGAGGVPRGYAKPRDPGLTKGTKSSVALNNLRALVILIVVAFHSALAYLGSQPASPFPFDQPPFEWRAFPILDSHRWFGFDIFCAWQDVYLMSLMFFLSALFTWPSLTRKGSGRFLADRFLRLGVPFGFALAVVVPIAVYPAYRVTAADPSLAAYARHFLALPFWPNGPMWFLWQLLALTVVAALLHRFAPNWVACLGRWSSSAGTHPGRYFAVLAAASALAYVPLAVAFTPWAWGEHGPFALQFSRPLLYAVFYFAGLGVGSTGLEAGLLASEGTLARRWPVWLAGALVSFVLWMGLTALAMSYKGAAPFGLQIIVDSSFALACASGCFCMVAACLRFGTMRSPLFDSLAKNAFGIYLLHYVFVVWLQYALLGVALFAVAKGMLVFAGALLLAWASTAALRIIPFGSRLIGESPPPRARIPSSSENFAVPDGYERDRRQLPPANLAR
jgi:glucans biosynthesis protein C